MGMIAGSNTRLEAYERCPHWFNLEHVKKVPAPKGPALLMGIAAHEFFADYVKHCVETGQDSDLTWAAAATPTYTAKVPPANAADVEAIIERFVHSYAAHPNAQVGVEVELAVTQAWKVTDWKDWDGAWFRFKIDRVYTEDGVLVVEDFKTDRQIDSRQNVETSPQLRRYALAASILWPDKVGEGVKVRLQYARYGVQREAFIDAGSLPKVKRDIEARMIALNADKKWNPTPGSHCDWCPYTARCPVYAQTWAKKPLVIGDPSQAAEVAKGLAYVKALAKEYEERLRSWVTANGPIDMGDGSSLGYVPVKKQSFPDVKRVVDGLLESGVEREAAWAALSVSKTGIEKSLRTLGRGQLKEHWPFFAGIAEDATETHFKVYRDKDAAGDGSD